ncbi:hypothetical protein OUZ56_015146 [Daphnia magna]|uniref:Uncharacterized protein n=1 Tax=Daphnia magna TaxID=35525 RepID=A0ABR0ALY2_9CRUS|nr:hypothetical protein OUZ56_015146 [Daphnia magna]
MLANQVAGSHYSTWKFHSVIIGNTEDCCKIYENIRKFGHMLLLRSIMGSLRLGLEDDVSFSVSYILTLYVWASPKPTYYIAVDRNMKRPNLKEPIRRDDLVANAMNCSNRIKQLKAFHFN